MSLIEYGCTYPPDADDLLCTIHGDERDTSIDRRTAGDPVQWARDVIEERRERLRQDHEALAALVERTRAERGLPARRRLAVFAIGSYDGDTSDLMAVLKRLFAGACYEVETISVLPVPEVNGER